MAYFWCKMGKYWHISLHSQPLVGHFHLIPHTNWCFWVFHLKTKKHMSWFVLLFPDAWPLAMPIRRLPQTSISAFGWYLVCTPFSNFNQLLLIGCNLTFFPNISPHGLWPCSTLQILMHALLFHPPHGQRPCFGLKLGLFDGYFTHFTLIGS